MNLHDMDKLTRYIFYAYVFGSRWISPGYSESLNVQSEST